MDKRTSRRVIGPLPSQIKTRARVRDLAEVYTHEREVTAMLDMVADMFPSSDDPGNHDRTFLEPACGSGNFLEEILRRKLTTVTTRRYGRGERYEHRLLRCLASTYGIDIDASNVSESRDRLRGVISSHLDMDLNTQAPTEGLATAVDTILATNIVRGDTLAESASIRLIHYRPSKQGYFQRQWSTLDDALNPRQMLLFRRLPIESLRDEVPIHYSVLALHPDPVSSGDQQ